MKFERFFWKNMMGEIDYQDIHHKFERGIHCGSLFRKDYYIFPSPPFLVNNFLIEINRLIG